MRKHGDMDGGPELRTEEEVVEPVVPLTPAEVWLLEAYEVRDVLGKGEVYSLDAIKRLMLSAIPVVEALKQSQSKPEVPVVRRG